VSSSVRAIEVDGIAELVALRARASRCFALACWGHVALVAVLSFARHDWALHAGTALAAAAVGSYAAMRGGGASGTDRLTAAIALAGLGVLVDPASYALATLAILGAYCDRRAILAAALLIAVCGSILDPQRALVHVAAAAAAAAALVWFVTGLRLTFRHFEAARRSHERERDLTLAACRELEAQAYRDALTGCRNRTFFMDRLETDLERANRRGDFRFALLFFDLDDFKLVNDTYGHRTGDVLLIEFARRIGEAIRPQDTLARLGGDEFVVIVEDVVDIAGVEAAGRRIGASLNRPFRFEGIELSLSASIGFADSIDGYDSPEAMLREADGAMYRAKRSRTAVSPSVVSAAKQRVALLTRRSRAARPAATLLLDSPH
jgi:diguanylate cyclase (GGDEF)-like protein